MDNEPVSMGGILDLATTQSDDIFVVRSVNCDASDSDKDRIFQQPHKHQTNGMEALSTYSECFFKQEQTDMPDAALLQSDDMNDSMETKLSSPDILQNDGKSRNISLKIEPTDLSLQGAMISSVCSSLPETPGDSGVLCLDSETSELISECPAGMTLSLVGAEELACDGLSLQEEDMKYTHESDSENVCKSAVNIKKYLNSDDVMTQSDIENQNITPPMYNFDVSETLQQFNKKSVIKKKSENLPDVVLKTGSCEFEKSVAMSETMKSASDDIVYRRKCKKKSNQSQPKKRVSFHEDILNNTKTDNIHIEHGFVSYRPQISMSYLPGTSFKKQNPSIGRYSWCAVGDTPYFDPQQDISLRNTQSDVLTYGNTDVSGFPDNSGIYEYQNYGSDMMKNTKKPCDSDTCIKKLSMCKCTREDSQKGQNESPVDQNPLYMCSCSSSDSNLSSESDTSSSQTLSFNSDTNYNLTAAKKCDNTQKSYSCDCIENNILRPMMKTMYFSDADINNHSDPNKPDADGQQDMMQMSDILPRASCLKKSSLKKKRYIKTDIIEEHDGAKNRTESSKGVRNLLDSKNLFGSLKNIYKNINFGLTIAERGVPEGSEDCQSVLEVLPTDAESTCDRNFLSKSFDTGFNENYTTVKETRVRGDGFCRNFTHEVDNQLRRKSNKVQLNKYETLHSEDEFNNIKNQSDKQNLTLDMKKDNGKTFIDWKSQNNYTLADENSYGKLGVRNKYIVNCESTVYEHKGVSYSYEYDAFQTTFDTSKDTFTPINDNLKTEPSTEKMLQENEFPLKTGEDVILRDLTNNSKELEHCKSSSFDLSSETDTLSESVDKAKSRLSSYILELAENGKVSKHLSSPLKQRNIMRYEKASKALLSDTNKDTGTISQDISNDCSEFEESLELIDGNEMNIKLMHRKTSLINKFLKNVSQKISLDSKLQNNSFFQKKLKEESSKFPNICFPAKEKISHNFKVSAKYLDSMINKEVKENKRISVKLMTADEPSYFDSFEENVAIECCEKLRLELFGDSSEILHRMLKVRSAYCRETGEWTPLLVFITDRALYVADVEHGKSTYNLRCYLTHDQLDIIVIGPDSQYVQIFDKLGSCQCTLITGDRYLCHRLVSSLEWSSRNSRVIIGPAMILGNIPSIVWKKRNCLNRALTKTTSVNMYEGSLFYGMVGSSCSTSCNAGRPASPFGPPLEGFLMCKTEKQKYWCPSFFILKSGVLSYGSPTPQTHLPHSIYLSSVLGVRRCTDVQGRPHCFEIALSAIAGEALQMAAPDDDTASQWLQGLLMHAAQALEGPKTDQNKKTLPPCCTLLATSQHIVTVREDLQPPKSLMDSDVTIRNQPLDDDILQDELRESGYGQRSIEVLSCASIKDLTAFKIPDNDDNWCILEFIFCEVREGTEMAFLFGSSAELERFIATVESLWHTTNEGVFPISIIPKSEVVSGKCSEWHDRLVSAWDRMLPAPQR